ncbi:hypothetical protein MXB_3482 [Myxobolus squamalis]|nr:hypothetical protein MXB_3482 [Myxobolus squamalis]
MAAFQLPLRNKQFEHIQQLCRNNATIEKIDNRRFPSLAKTFLISGVMNMMHLSNHTGTLPAMLDRHGIQRNVKHLGLHLCKRRVSLLQIFTRYHNLTEVSLATKACGCGL